jgi:E3 ubiquitin-protein ligase UBR7
VTGEEAAMGNKYDQNFRNQFCGCSEQYDANEQKGTMFQCLGLGYADEGGCGEDWWHPECVVGLNHEEYKLSSQKQKEDSEQFRKNFSTMIKRELSFERSEEDANGHANVNSPSIITEIHGNVTGPLRATVPNARMMPAINTVLLNRDGNDGNDVAAGIEIEQEEDEDPLPPGFPAEDDFDHMLCYKCVEANPWIKRYAGTPGFLPPVYKDASVNALPAKETESSSLALLSTKDESKKRKVDDNEESSITSMAPPKRQRSVDPAATLSSIPETTTLTHTPKKRDSSVCKLNTLPPAPDSNTPFSLFLQPDFRDFLCHCVSCFPLLKAHPQLLEEEDTYEPPMSVDGENEGAASAGTGSIYDRGEAAFNNMDRVRAIQGAMAYAHLKDNLKGFLKPFAESGKAVGAEDIKAYFEKLRGDEQGIKEAAGGAKASKGDEDDAGPGADGRKEQSGY